MPLLPLVRAAAPGRVNLIGEHLDYNGGRCLPIALDRRTVATVRASPDEKHRVRSGDLAWSGSPGERAEGWAAYVVGVLEALDVRVPLDIGLRSTVPVGSGLSSSAALEAAVATAVDRCLGLGLPREELAALCVRAETEYVGAPTGGLDQAAAFFCSPGHALLIDFADDTRVPVPWRPEPAGLSLLVVDTGVRHKLTDGGYAERRAVCEVAAEQVNVPWLAAAALADLDRLDGPVRRRARHVVTEQARVDAIVEALRADAWADVGGLMTASHASLRDDFEVSCPELDAVVDTALEAGAAGARMTGGGFGGSAILLVPTGRLATVTSAIAADPVWNGREAPTLFRVEASRAAEVLSIS